MANNSIEKTQRAELTAPEPTRAVTLTPRVDILENEQELLLFADLPGVKQDQVDIRFERGELTLHARRPLANTGGTFVSHEVETADYFRSFVVGEKIDSDKIWAELKNGVLTLHLPKVEAVKPRKITVKNG